MACIQFILLVAGFATRGASETAHIRQHLNIAQVTADDTMEADSTPTQPPSIARKASQRYCASSGSTGCFHGLVQASVTASGNVAISTDVVDSKLSKSVARKANEKAQMAGIEANEGDNAEMLADYGDQGEPRLFDAFMLNHEFDTFRAHVFENAERVHAFIVVETEFTFKTSLKTSEEMGVKPFLDTFPNGKIASALIGDHGSISGEIRIRAREELVVKPFLEKFRRENPSLPKIHYVLAAASSVLNHGRFLHGWVVENIARDHILRGFEELGGENRDLIMLADVDEIFNGHSNCWGMLRTHDLSSEIVHFTTPSVNNFKHSFKCHQEGMWWKGPVVTSGRVLREIGAQNVRESVHGGGCADRNSSNLAEYHPFKFPCTLSDNKRVFIPEEKGCSWQLSNFGGAEIAKRKIEQNFDSPFVHLSSDRHAEIVELRKRMNRCEKEITFTFPQKPDFYVRNENTTAMQFPQIPWYVARHRRDFDSFFHA